MRTKVLFPIVLFTLSFFPAQAAVNPSLDQLAAIQTLLRVELDGVRLCPQELAGLSKTAIAGLPMLLQAEIQEKLEGLSPDARNHFFHDVKRSQACVSRCRCGIYADWIGNDSQLASDRAKLLEREKKAHLSASAYESCARMNQVWICRHPVFRALVKAAKENMKAQSE